jgi:GMP synthase (glutamine-hydrolysing)
VICIIDCGTSWLEEIKRNVAELKKPHKVIALNGIRDCNPESFSGIIISGAPILLTQGKIEKYMDLFKFIKTADIPILSICLGHQILGLVYGSHIHIGKKIDKEERIEIVKRDDLFLGIENRALFREEHSESITLPKEFCLLAKSESCANEAMKHKHKKLYGTQFHPEVSGSDGKKLFRNFLKMCS